MLSDDNGTKPRASANNSTVDTSTAADDKSSADAIVIGNEEPTRTYILQINSFDNADDADKRRAEVLMAGWMPKSSKTLKQ